ncbi:hypothetical protein H5410_063870 [Solanum commersonii]|uniref:Uncharacterized protein n=1 Tax=Solanum commersonii TaxID=4109 RepID=A0A9J5WGL5_SOLCO|nr:hypothetical protein H5410_063870 [Solanum commersonii]
MAALVLGQRDMIDKVMIDLDGSSWHPANDVARALKDSEKAMGCTPLVPEVFKKTHIKKKENESDPDVWEEERAERTFLSYGEYHQYVNENLDSSVQMTPELSSLEGIGSSRQAEVIDGVQIAAMSAQIEKLTAALQEFERKRVAEQESMSAVVQQNKEQVLNLTRQLISTSSPTEGTDDDSEEDGG